MIKLRKNHPAAGLGPSINRFIGSSAHRIIDPLVHRVIWDGKPVRQWFLEFPHFEATDS
jgi:hypothetical protein